MIHTKISRHQQVHRATLATGAVHVILGIAKVCFGIWGHSQALVADGLHSFADLLTDGLVIIASRIGGQAADADHPYGHARIETVVAVALSLVLLAVGIGVLSEGVLTLLNWSAVAAVPMLAVLVVAGISVFANEGLFFYLKHVANRVDSRLLLTNAWHCRSDAASSLVVLLGATGAYFGFPLFDPIAACVVSFLIIKMACDLGWPCLRELIDTGLTPSQLSDLEKIIHETPGVKALHQLRTRSMAGDVYVDVHVLVSPKLSVSEGHYIGELVQKRLLDRVADVKDVTVHVDPEDDERFPTMQHLPTRQNLLEKLKQNWQNHPAFDQIQQYRLHYLSGKVYVEIYFPYACVRAELVPDLVKHYSSVRAVLPEISEVTLFFIAT